MRNGKPLAIELMPYDRPWNNVELIKDCGLIPWLLARDYGFEVHLIGKCPEKLSPGLYDETRAGDISTAYPYYSYVKDMKLRLVDDYTSEARTRLLKAYAPETDLLILRGCYPSSISYAHLYKKLNPAGKVFCALDANSGWMDHIYWDAPDFLPLFQDADVIATSCTAMGRLLSKKWPVHVYSIFNGNIDFSSAFSHFTPYSEREKIILTVGRLGTEQKATRIILNAFLQIKDVCPNWKLELIGPETPEMKEELQHLFSGQPRLRERILELGEITDRNRLSACYRNARIFALSSTMEGGTPNAAADALRAGLAMAVTEVDAYEDMTASGTCGFSSPIGDIGAFAENLKKLCQDPDLETKGKAAFEQALKNFDMEKNVAKLYSLLYGTPEEVRGIQETENAAYALHEDKYWKEEILPDFSAAIKNRSRLRLQNTTQDTESSPSVLNLYLLLEKLYPSAGSASLLNLLLTGMLLHFPGTAPVRLAEFGCGNGELSAQMAEALSYFNPANSYTAVTDQIGDGSEDRWVENAARAELPAGVSYLVADFSTTNLQEKSFDIILINGQTTLFSSPPDVVSEAVRLCRAPGYILYIPSENPEQNKAFETAIHLFGSDLYVENEKKKYCYLFQRPNDRLEIKE